MDNIKYIALHSLFRDDIVKDIGLIKGKAGLCPMIEKQHEEKSFVSDR